VETSAKFDHLIETLACEIKTLAEVMKYFNFFEIFKRFGQWVVCEYGL
jgi:hypothetical protein